MVEQISFFIMSIYFIFLERPKTIYSPDFTLLRLYVILKKLSGSKYKTILCNGGNYKPPYYGIEIVQFILPQYADGIDFDNKVIIPHGFDCNKFIANKTKKQYRNDLGLPVEKKIILSVGAINCGVKRMDYLINEVAALTDTNLFLLIIGQKDEESKEIEKMATRKLGRNFEIRSVDYDTIQDYYLACDIFCLASLHETFGKVLIEAAICKLPVLVHDFEVSRMVLCEYAHYGNFAIVGNLSKLIDDLMKHCFEYDLDAASSLAKERFSWDRLSKQYVQMLS